MKKRTLSLRTPHGDQRGVAKNTSVTFSWTISPRVKGGKKDILQGELLLRYKKNQVEDENETAC